MSQNVRAIQAYLYEHIPLSKVMQVQVKEVESNRVVLAAPLLPNINHRSTVFGGSASTLAILSGWTLINFRLRNEGFTSRLVIQKNTMSYNKPIINDFEAVCCLTKAETWDRFSLILRRKQKSRITVDSWLRCDGERVGEFTRVYVALGI